MPMTARRPELSSSPRPGVLLRGYVGAALRQRRSAQGRTLRDVARSADVSLGYLSEVERGVKEASSELLASICRALDVALAELLLDVAGALVRDDVVNATTVVAAPLELVAEPAPAADVVAADRSRCTRAQAA